MKKLYLISVMVICGLLCFAPLAFCGVSLVSIGFNSGTLYGIVGDGSVCKFVSISVSTGLMTVINSNIGPKVDFSVLNILSGSCIDSATNTYYAVKAGVAQVASTIISINLGTGAVTVSPELHF